MEEKVSIVGLEGGGWEAMYVNGTLVYENRSVTWEDLARILDLNVGGFVVADDWAADNSFPQDIAEIPDEAKV